ncbi:MAG: hypothetical protein R3F35_10305 [Myxococcota bacterium]
MHTTASHRSAARRPALRGPAILLAVPLLLAAVGAWAETGVRPVAETAAADAAWELADRSGRGDAAVELFVERAPTPGRPTFRLETGFDVPPSVARAALLESMLDPGEAPRGQRREVLERTADGAIVYTYIDLPLMLADREVALRVVASSDAAADVHRIEWSEANELLPPADPSVVRLTGAAGYWEFRPDGHGGTRAIHETRTELGGSFPVALGDRLMRSQAVESVESLRARIARRDLRDVAAGPPR